MTQLAAPLVLAAHAEHLPTLPGWDGVAVYEGAAVRRDDVAAFLTLGYVAGSTDATVSIEPVPRPDNTTREAGSIVCQLLLAAADVPAARERVFDLLGAWAGWLVTDRTLAAGGHARLMQGSELHLSADVALATTRNGATADAVVTITYSALTYG